MLGIIPDLMLSLVESTAGAEALLAVKNKAGLAEEASFCLGDPYDDELCLALLHAICEVLDLSRAEAEKAFARFFLADSLERWPMWFEMAANAREFLAMVPTIHNSLAAGIADPQQRAAIDDKFEVLNGPDKLLVLYRSPNDLCGLFRSLADEVLRHFGEEAVVEEVACTKDGAPECRFHISWPTDTGER